jgi:arylsulfatase A
MQRRNFLSLAAGAPAYVSALGAGKPMNILVVLCDDLGYGDLGCYGHRQIRTPNLDKFAGEGVRFTDCYSAAPVCSPSRAGLLTGRTPNRCGIYDWIPPDSPMHLRREELTIAKVLRKAGYATIHSGKWHLSQLTGGKQPTPGDHGFGHWFSTPNNAAPSHANPRNFVRNGQEVGPLEGFASDLVADETMRWLDGVSTSQPFFGFVCFHEPHEPVASPEDLVKSYPNAKNPDEAQYFANVTQMDRTFGRLMAYLDKRGQRDNTLVFFTSDNGPETLNRYKGSQRSYGSPGPLRGMKLHLTEAGYRVAGMARLPGKTKAGTVSGEPVASLDLFEAACELASVNAPKGPKRDGANILRALEGKKMSRKTPLHWHYFLSLGGYRASMRDGDWKILGRPKNGPDRPAAGAFQAGFMQDVKGVQLDEFELYNVRQDVGEAKPAEDKRKMKMADTLLKLHEEVKAEGVDWRKV